MNVHVVGRRQLVIEGERPEDDEAMRALLGQLESAHIPYWARANRESTEIQVHLRRATDLDPLAPKLHEAVEVYDGMH